MWGFVDNLTSRNMRYNERRRYASLGGASASRSRRRRRRRRRRASCAVSVSLVMVTIIPDPSVSVWWNIVTIVTISACLCAVETFYEPYYLLVQTVQDKLKYLLRCLRTIKKCITYVDGLHQKLRCRLRYNQTLFYTSVFYETLSSFLKCIILTSLTRLCPRKLCKRPIWGSAVVFSCWPLYHFK